MRRTFGEAGVDSVNFVKRTGQLKALMRDFQEAKQSLHKANAQLNQKGGAQVAPKLAEFVRQHEEQLQPLVSMIHQERS